MTSPVQHKLMAVANNIRNQRMIKNYSQEYLAICLKISQNAYSKIEMGYTRITFERLFQIAIVLNGDVNVLLEVPQDVLKTA